MNGPRSTLKSVLVLRAWRVGIIALPIQVCYFVVFYLGLRTGKTFAVGTLLLLVLSLWLYLAYIVLVNDYADRAVDAAVGKGTPERGHGLSPDAVRAILVAVLAASALAVISIRGGVVFDALWVVAFALGTAYSLPPFSLKERGAAGLIADSMIEKPLPVLIVFAFFEYYGPEVLIFPVLGELLDAVFKHQARDHDIDVKEGVKTFAVRLGKPLSDSVVEATHRADVFMVVVAFATVILEIPEVRTAAALWLAALLLLFCLAAVRFRGFLFHPMSAQWSAPARWDDPPFVVLFNSGFQALLTPTLGFALVLLRPSFLPILVLFLISLAPYIFAYALVALVRSKLLGGRS